MPMNLVIQERRKQLGLTQEQVAESLNVSIPAVSKWETGSTNPDISILPQLARLLKIDLNTLFCFQEEMNNHEIIEFCKQIIETFQTVGVASAFETAKEKIQQFPHNDTLLHTLCFQLQGHLSMSGLSENDRMPYTKLLQSWYKRLSCSEDPQINNSAKYMLASGYIHSGEYENAQEVLDTMPDRNNVLSNMADKQLLQVAIYQHTGETQKAVKELQQALLFAAQRVQLIMGKLLDAELLAGNHDIAKNIAEKTSQLPSLLDLWEYGAYPSLLQIALWEKDEDKAIMLTEKMLSLMNMSHDNTNTALFYQIPSSVNFAQMLPVIIDEMEHDPAYDFLRGNIAFEQLINSYKA